MKGLLKNNFYAAQASAKWLFAALALLGSALVITGGGQAWAVPYSLLCMACFPVNALAALRRESSSKWNKYKLTTPVRRSDIIKSYFISQLLWMLAGAALSGAFIGASALLGGVPFDRELDLLMVFTCGTSVNLFVSALFYPLFYLGGEDRSEAALGIGLVGAVGIVAALVWAINLAFGFKMNLVQTVLSAAILLACALAFFAASYFFTSAIFKRKEY